MWNKTLQMEEKAWRKYLRTRFTNNLWQTPTLCITHPYQAVAIWTRASDGKLGEGLGTRLDRVKLSICGHEAQYIQDNWPINLLPPKFLGVHKFCVPYSPDPPPFFLRSCWGSGETKWLLQAIKTQSQREGLRDAKWLYGPDSCNKCTAGVTSNVESWTVDNP